ncbi:MAG: DUF4956 domain-containing protein [Clostridia bacterium]|nr:DUF4956 domain-containing protein [Clostridia bacterium]
MYIFDSITDITADYVQLDLYLLCLAGALACGFIAALGACVRSRPTKSFIVSLILLPMIVTTVIMMVNGSVGTGVAVMGAFSLIRFRSVPGKARDIVAIFLSMTAGLACASGFVAIALLFTLIVAGVLALLSLIPFGSEHSMDLHITVPEALRFAGAFDDLFKQYLTSCRLVRARTTNMGSLYKLQYRVRLKKAEQMQEFIDELRCRNGNLEISLCDLLDSQEEL